MTVTFYLYLLKTLIIQLLLTLPNELVTSTSYSPLSANEMSETRQKILYFFLPNISIPIWMRSSGSNSWWFRNHLKWGAGKPRTTTSNLTSVPSANVASFNCTNILGEQFTVNRALASACPHSLIILHKYSPDRSVVGSFTISLIQSSVCILVNSGTSSLSASPSKYL